MNTQTWQEKYAYEREHEIIDSQTRCKWMQEEIDALRAEVNTPKQCTHSNVVIDYEHVTCKNCGKVKHDAAGNGWHETLNHAKNYAKGLR